MHFAILGSLLFAVFAYLNPLEEAPEQVLVSMQKIRQLNTIFSKKWQRPTRPAEIKSLIDDYVLEEIYYREALSMQMDKDDIVVRRRLRQKMEFLMMDISQSMNPTQSQLQVFLDQHSSDFEVDARYSFTQIYLDPGKHSNMQQTISKMQSQLASGQAVGDATMLPKIFTDSPATRVGDILGKAFVTQLPQLQLGQWQGPIRSSHGLHWVYLERHVAASKPVLKEDYAKVEREWRYDLLQRTKADINQKLFKKYSVQIDWPRAKSVAKPDE